MKSNKIKRATDDLRKSDYGKTWIISTDESISQALTEILRATMEDEEKLNGKGILFYIANQSQPLIITDQDIVRIGRVNGSSASNINLDLSKYHGAELGVSRNHAEISYTDGTYFIKDMGSTNGTWINGTKIIPYRQTLLQDSDQLRLGHFTMLVKFAP